MKNYIGEYFSLLVPLENFFLAGEIFSTRVEPIFFLLEKILSTFVYANILKIGPVLKGLRLIGSTYVIVICHPAFNLKLIKLIYVIFTLLC